MCCNAETLWLAPHPACAAQAAWVRIQAGVAWDCAARALRLRFRLTADAAARLRIPPASALPGPRDGLWRHTCLEAFIGGESGAYREFNFAPSGDWAAYAFADTRVRADGDSGPAGHDRDAHDTHDAREPPPAPSAIWTHRTDGLDLDARISALALPADAGTALRMGLAAVLEHENGSPATALSYWALAHPRSIPDFHDRAGWTFRPGVCS